MNALEIEEALSNLPLQPFDAAAFTFEWQDTVLFLDFLRFT
jgi:hypothetical protein